MIDEAVRLKVEQILSNGGFCTKEQVKKISSAAAQEIYEQFSIDVKEITTEVDKIRERTDKLWDVVTNPPLKSSRLREWLQKFLGWLLFWRD